MPLLTRYLLGSGTIRMNILLDEVLPRGAMITLANDTDLGADAGLKWEILDRFETLECMVVSNVEFDNT